MRLADMLLHDKTRQAVQTVLSKRAHAVVLAGPAGAGKQTLATAMAAELLGLTPDRLALAPYFLLLQPEGTAISIEQVRRAQQFLRLKTTGQAAVRRVLALQGADSMTAEAQNALLKTLEEPPADTVLLLTADDIEKLLPTIRSRSTILRLHAPSVADARTYYADQKISTAAFDRLHAMSGGQVGLLHTLITQQDTGSGLPAAIEQAKQLLAQTVFERLTQVDALAKDKAGLAHLLTALKRICDGALQAAARKNNTDAVRAWHQRLAAVAEAEVQFAKNTSPKLLLTHLFLHL
ncbi:hypothetical protein CR970_02920 [Candidatus Saccharibacteria bacterium]|nr:MAG: hypothetical protein CR970_02920 [Candidatus Saccharibacteria bacterium]